MTFQRNESEIHVFKQNSFFMTQVTNMLLVMKHVNLKRLLFISKKELNRWNSKIKYIRNKLQIHNTCELDKLK